MVQFLKENPRAFFQDTLTKIIYGTNPWADNFPSEARYNKLSLDGVMAAYNKMFGNARGMHFTFVGNLDEEKVKPLLAKYLGSLPSTNETVTYKDNGVRPVKGVVSRTISRGKEPQSLISLTFTGNAKYTPQEDMAFQAMLEVLNIRITEKLREEMSGIYGGGFYGSIVRRPYEHYNISGSMPCGPENVDKLTAALMGLITDLQQKGPDKDLDKVKEAWRKQHRVNLQNNEFLLSYLSGAWIDRNDPEELLQYEKMIDALSATAVQAAAKKYLNKANYVKVVLYPENAKATPPPAKAF